jgi:hypothetical protein
MNVRAISILGKPSYSTMLGIRSIFLTVVIICVFGLDGITQVVATASSATEQQASNAYLPFDGKKTTWHGFDRYDFIMDDATGAITPMTAPESEVTSFGIDVSLKDGKRRCVVVVPKKAAPGYPWSWRGCYWNHQPQTEIELLKRGFHIAYVAPDAGRQGKAWDRWYAFMTENHGLAKKAAFIGMSKGGVNEFNWGVVNPDKVACIYADNPALYEEDFAKIPYLAKHDVPILEIGGTEDGLLRPNALDIEDIYHKAGGLITVMIKEGCAHHPHSLQNAKPIADWIEQHMTPSTANRPAFVDTTYAKRYYYSLEPSYIYLNEEATYATARGPGFTECYDRYDVNNPATFRLDGISIIVPKTVAQGKPWLFTGDPIERDATVEQALLAKGYHIVIVPMEQKWWDNTYKLLVDNGFSSKPVLKGTGPKAGEAYAWAIANPDKVSCIYARNPLMRSLMAKSLPIDNLAPLAKAGVPILHDCGSLDPWLNDQTRVVEKRYKELGGQITVIIREGDGHFPLSPKNPKPVVEFIIEKAAAMAAASSPRGAPGPIPPPRLAEDFLAAATTVADRTTPAGYTGQYFKLYYPGISDEGQQRFAVTYTLWIPDGVKTLRGIIVHQHGAGMTASKEGSTAAYDLHWQALARKWDCALLGPCYHVLNDGDWDAAGSIYWMDPRRGSEKTFLKALHDFSVQTGHAELATVPWALWGHSAGGIWSDIMSTLHPDRVIAVYCRSGSQPVFFDRPLQVPTTTVTPAACAIPMMLSCGIKED